MGNLGEYCMQYDKSITTKFSHLGVELQTIDEVTFVLQNGNIAVCSRKWNEGVVNTSCIYFV